MVRDTQDTNKQHAVPQNIMDVEFKLVGQLTMRQFSYLLAFGLIGYFIQQLLIGLFKWPLALTSWLIGIGFAFVPIEERGLDEWAVNFVKAVYKPTQRIWKKNAEIPSVLASKNADIVKQELITLAPTASRRRLEEYLDYTEKEEVDPLDISEEEYFLRLQKAYGNYSPSKTSTKVKSEPKVTLKGPQKNEVQEKTEEILNSDKPEKREKEKSTSAKEAIIKGDTQIIKPRAVPGPEAYKPRKSLLKPITPDMHSGRKFTNLLPSRGELVLPIRGEKVINFPKSEERSDVKDKAAKLQQLLAEIKRSEGIYEHKKVQTKVVTSEPAAEETKKEAQDVVARLKSEIKKIADRLSQVRKDPNLEDKENLIDQLEKQKREVEEKYRKLKDQMNSLKKETDAPLTVDKKPKKTSSEPTNEKTEKEVQDLIAKLKSEIKKITDRLSQVRKDPNLEDKENLIDQLEKQKREVEKKYHLINKQVTISKEEVTETKSNPPVSFQSVSANEAYTKNKTINKTNIVRGVVKNASGKIMPGVLMIIRDENGEPIRAFKTNSLGEFLLSTPLRDGNYTLEVSQNNDIDETFDIISIEASGEIIPPLEIKGK